MQPADHPTLLAIWETTPGLTIRKADSYQGFCCFLERNSGLSLVAEVAGRIIGGILGGHDGRFGSIHHLVVLPEYRQQGIGRALIKRCLNQIKSQGIEKCHVFINRDNEQGLDFWITSGWIERVDLAMASYTFS